MSKKREIFYFRNVTLIGNDSGSIQDKAVKFACVLFGYTADRMV